METEEAAAAAGCWVLGGWCLRGENEKFLGEEPRVCERKRSTGKGKVPLLRVTVLLCHCLQHVSLSVISTQPQAPTPKNPR